jgi:hypothetical protein
LGRNTGGRASAAIRVSGGFLAWGEGVKEALHEVERTAQEQVILLSATLDAEEELVVFIHERLNEGLINGWKLRDEFGESLEFRESEFLGDGLATKVAVLADLTQGLGLLLDVSDGSEQVFGGAMDDEMLLAFEEREHFAIVLEFDAESSDELFDLGVHGVWLEASGWEIAIGVGLDRGWSSRGAGSRGWGTSG